MRGQLSIESREQDGGKRRGKGQWEHAEDGGGGGEEEEEEESSHRTVVRGRR